MKRKVRVIVPFSGGKDSEATLIYAIEKYGADRVTAVFCDTKWDHEITYAHIKYVIDALGVEFVNLTSTKFDGFVGLVKDKTFPRSGKKRLCTVFLKVEPMIDFILSLRSHVIILQGIRADESPERALMSEQCRFFKYYFEPYQTNSMIVEKYSAMPKLNKLQEKKLATAKERLAKSKEDKKYHTYRKEDVFAFCEKYADDIDRPFFNATGNEVIYYSLNRGLLVHPFYFLGISRIGCFPCIMATLEEMSIIVKKFDDVIQKIRDAEAHGRGTFFAPNYIPKRYHSGYDEKSKKTFPYIDDVVRYLNDRMATGNLFENDPEFIGCQSVYAICE